MFANGLGSCELIVVGLVALLLFGRWLPDLTREVMRGLQDLDYELRDQSRRRWRLEEYEQDEAEKLASKMERVGRIIVVIATILLVIGIFLYFFK